MSYKGKKKSRFYDSAEGYDLYAPFYDQKLEYLDSFEKDEVPKLLVGLWRENGKKNLTDKIVLDLGCGTGRLTGNLLERGASVIGVDVSREMLNILKKKFPQVETVLADVENLPFEDNRFDLVMANFLIVHLKDLDLAFREIYRVLKDDGFLILTNINQRKAPKLKAGNEEVIIKSFYHRPEDVIKNLEENFFKIEKEEFVMENNIWVNQVIKARK